MEENTELQAMGKLIADQAMEIANLRLAVIIAQQEVTKLKGELENVQTNLQEQPS